ncbi:hypothetical protein [Blastopirellula marina]|uniref:SPW repeat-containing integral membrane domain-containing protein n=1 Tax=Blastopirellula marina TaxID=124 RepID=A0A2S8GAK3_9BACT|nr:hypothetical protein [Blastopirellula marina]PQO41124.1 hypothetical protein C5Y98_03975 [Blastopirellula marina]PTL46000.1 hypothetical protein C5Y97_03975 [Blastopirellula marina]
MWARVTEFMLGCWMLCSPFIFRGENRGDTPEIWDFAAGFLILTFALLSYWERTRYAHVGTLLLSIGMVFGPRLALAPHIPPAGENFMMIGLLLLMFALVPNQATHPPHAWRSRT